MPVVSVLNRFKNKELLAAFGQESVVLAAKVEKLGNFLHRGGNFLDFLAFLLPDKSFVWFIFAQ